MTSKAGNVYYIYCNIIVIHISINIMNTEEGFCTKISTLSKEMSLKWPLVTNWRKCLIVQRRMRRMWLYYEESLIISFFAKWMLNFEKRKFFSMPECQTHRALCSLFLRMLLRVKMTAEIWHWCAHLCPYVKSALNQSMRFLERTASDLPVSKPVFASTIFSSVIRLLSHPYKPLLLYRTKLQLFLMLLKLLSTSFPTMPLF